MASFTSYRSSDSTLVGDIDGSNTVYTATTTADFVEVYVDGVQQENTVNYTWSVVSTTLTITFVDGQAPASGSLVVAWVFKTS